MMNNLSRVLDSAKIEEIKDLIDIRFKEPKDFKTPEAMILYEERLVDSDTIIKLCEEIYNTKLYTPAIEYLPRDVIEFYENTNCIPYKIDHSNMNLYVMVLPEHKSNRFPKYKEYNILYREVPLHYYVKEYSLLYGKPDFLLDMAEKDIFLAVCHEAIRNKSSNVEMFSSEGLAIILYRVGKQMKKSNRVVTNDILNSLVGYIRSMSKFTKAVEDNMPEYMDIDINKNYRGRVCITKTYFGYSINMRIIDRENLNLTFTDLNLSANTRLFLKTVFMNDEPGLRLIVGPPNSGKNTTMQACLKWKKAQRPMLIISVEKPVEIIMPDIVQISVETAEEFKNNVMALIREDPDIGYLSEINDASAKITLDQSNVAKPIYSTIHANSVGDVIVRLQDLTKYSTDRIISCLHSVVFQDLEENSEGKLYPVNHCFYFSDEIKYELYGKDLGDILRILKERRSVR